MRESERIPLISVIVPVYNVENYLENCIESILKQTVQNIEIVLVDDGSEDNSGVICNQYAQRDPRICVVHQENKGLSVARNIGIEHSRGDYIAFIDSDDTIDREMLGVLYSRMITDNSELALCGFKRMDQENHLVCEFTLPDDVISGFRALEMWYQENGVLFVSACNKLYKKALFQKVRFPAGRFHEDEFTLYQVLDLCNKVSIVNRPMYLYYARSGSIMEQAYSVRRLDGVEASFLRYQFFQEKGEKYRVFLQSECDVFTPLYFQSKRFFHPKNRAEKKRVRELDKMARKICFDLFFILKPMRKLRLLMPHLFLLAIKAKSSVRNIT